MASVKKGFSLSHCFTFYKKKHEKRGANYKVSKKEYRDVCCAFNKKLTETILTGRIFSIPHGLGDFCVRKFETDWEKPPVDLRASKLAGKQIFHLNDHSDGFWARWYWKRACTRTTNLIYYSFAPSRANSRAIATAMKKPGGHKMFFS
tara:strand:+ start:316 stop:759 length:444 start_codon:yes stop_codon:yes gene_type:complete